MKPIESKLKTHSGTWITPVLIIFIAFFAIAMVSPIYSAPPNQCDPSFCDQDGDGFFRDHKRCAYDICAVAIDCDDNDPDNNCNGGSSGSYIWHNFANRVIWGSDGNSTLPYETNEVGSQIMRLCGPGSQDPVTNPNPQGIIQYVCHSDADFLYGRDQWNIVFLDLSTVPVGDLDGELNASGRDPALCNRLVELFDEGQTGLAIVPKKEQVLADCRNSGDPYCDVPDPVNVGRLSAYYFGVDESNDEPCTWDSNPGSSCHVTIFTQGFFWNECNERRTKCGRRIGLKAYGHVLPAPEPGDSEPTEINPFTQNQTIVVEELNGFFMGIGTNRSEANCYLNNVIEGGGYHYENLVFRTCVDADENDVCDSGE